MTNLDDVYRKFGEAAEAAQLIETELGTLLLIVRAEGEGLSTGRNPARASDILDTINRSTIGQLINGLNASDQSVNALDSLLIGARAERNRLFHSFYRQHNFRKNSDKGRALMMEDLESIHNTLLNAYEAILLLSGVDLSILNTNDNHLGPTEHLPIR